MAIQAYVLIQTEVGRSTLVAEEIAGLEGVVFAHDIAGPYDVLARIEADDLDQLGRMMVFQLQRIDGVTRTITCPIVHP